jgi:hypothetical protein
MNCGLGNSYLLVTPCHLSAIKNAFRYRVEFDNGACDSFFGFELELENAVD